MKRLNKAAFAPVSQLNRGNARKIIETVKNNTPVYIMKNNEPEAVMVPVEYFQEVEEILFYRMVAERIRKIEEDPNPKMYTLEEVMNELGITQEEIDKMPDVELDYE